MIELHGTIIIPSASQDRALPALERHIRATRREAGCLLFAVTQDANDAELFHVHEQFTDQEAFDRHQRLGKRRVWGRIARDFKRAYAIQGHAN